MAPLENLVRISNQLLQSGSIALFLKGKSFQAELAVLASNAGIVCEVLPSVTSSQAAIIRVSHKVQTNEENL
jgi:MinD superfamily P-loop ATPase